MRIEDTTKDLLAVINELRLDNFVLYGDVFSTYTIMSVAAQLGASVRGIVLVTPTDFAGAPLMSDWEEMYTHSWELFTNTFASMFGSPGSSGLRLREKVNHEDFVSLALSARGHFLMDLLPEVKTPVLILCHRQTAVPTTLPTARKITAALPMAELVLLDGHRISDILSSQNDDLPPALQVIEDFLSRLPNPAPPEQAGRNGTTPVRLSAREQEVLRLIAAGTSNQQIADELVISLSTVAKHVTSILSKTESANRTTAAAYARDHGIA
jgi:DNA-binding CsgD family transcriptional regulator